MNDFFNHVTNRIALGVKARSTSVNAIADEVAAGFELLPGKVQLAQGTTAMITDTGSANAYVVTYVAPLVPATYVDGQHIRMRILNTSTGASTLNANALGLKDIKRADGTAVLANDLIAGEIYDFWFDATADYFILPGTRNRIPVENAAGTVVLVGGG